MKPMVKPMKPIMMKSVYKNLGLVVFGFGISNLSMAAIETKIGTVDMQKALQSVETGKKAKAQLEKDFNAKKKELQGEEASIKKMTEEFKKQSLVMSDEARGKKQGELQERIMKFQELTARSQSEIQQKERDLTQPIIVKLRTIIADAAKKHDYSVVLEKNENSVLYSQEKDDLTNEVISTFDKQHKTRAD
jgi:outer membrane protein